MDRKKLILAVAGSGKTKLVIETLNLEQRFLIITYTNNNYKTIKRRIATRFGYIPNNITILKFFDFIYSFCAKPFLFFEHKLKGIYWDEAPTFTRTLKSEDYKRYITKSNLLYYNRISKFIEITGTIPLIIEKLEKFYDYFIIDEFQDLGGHDFNLIMALSQAKTEFLYVGDFFQHTFTTSLDGATNINLYNDYSKYIKRLQNQNINVDTKTLLKSHRCPPAICQFISDNLGIKMESNRTDETVIQIVNLEQIEEILSNNEIIKLVYNSSNKLPYYSKNWGDCKGEDDYHDTCIIMTKSGTKSLDKGDLKNLVSSTKNKLYVALSRTKGDCYILRQK